MHLRAKAKDKVSLTKGPLTGFIQQTTTGEDGPFPDQIGGRDQHLDLAKARAKEKEATAKSDGAPTEDSPLRLGKQPLVRLAPITANPIIALLAAMEINQLSNPVCPYLGPRYHIQEWQSMGAVVVCWIKPVRGPLVKPTLSFAFAP